MVHPIILTAASSIATTGVTTIDFIGIPILVMFGMHYSIMPMQIQQVAELGYTPMLPSAIAANI